MTFYNLKWPLIDIIVIIMFIILSQVPHAEYFEGHLTHN